MVLLLALLVVFGGGHLLPVFYQPAYAAEVSLTSTTVGADRNHAAQLAIVMQMSRQDKFILVDLSIVVLKKTLAMLTGNYTFRNIISS